METVSFTIYQNNELKKITAQDLFRNKRILICSIVRPWMNIPDQYADYLEAQKAHFQSLGIDEIYFVNSSDGLFLVAKYDLIHPELVMLHDNDNGLVSYLREQQGKTDYTVEELSKYWSYQVLIEDGKIEKFYDQPLDKYVKHLVKAGLKLSLDTHKFVVTEGDRVTLFRPTLLPVEQERVKSPNGLIYYFNLWPNTKLEQYLIDTQHKT